jgi:hypothetical protein
MVMPFQDGDRVRVVNTHDHYIRFGFDNETVATVIRGTESVDPEELIEVESVSGQRVRMFQHRVVPLGEDIVEDPTQRQFRRGDRVRYTLEASRRWGGEVGVSGHRLWNGEHEVVTVDRVVSGDRVYSQETDTWTEAHDLELVTEENEEMPTLTPEVEDESATSAPEHELQVGDVVRLIGSGFGRHARNSLARIVAYVGRQYTAEVMQGEEGEGHTQYFRNPREVEIVEQIRTGDVVYLTHPNPQDVPRLRDARVEHGVAYSVHDMIRDNHGRYYIRVQDEERNSNRWTWCLPEHFSKSQDTQPDPIKKFWMVIRDDARQTQKRHYNYDDAVAESKRLSNESPDNSFVILEALITVKSNGSTHSAEILED